MKRLCLFLLFHASLQLRCDKNKVTAQIRGEFLLTCTYDTSRYLYSKKYWCRGASRSTCEILVHSDGGVKNPHTLRTHIVDGRRRGLFVKVTDLRFDDTGVYWVGIDKIYHDIVTSVEVVITEVPVSKPSLWPLSSLAGRPTCWGQPVTVRCGCARGTAVRYTWFQNTPHGDVLLHHSSDLDLHCGKADEDSDYYCIASNDISSQRSQTLSVQVLRPADSSCIYVANMQGQPIYDCADRMSTTMATTPPPPTTCQATIDISSLTRNQSLQTSQTYHDLFFSRLWTGVPLWYTMLRWGSFLFLLVFLCVVIECTKARRRRAQRKRKVRFRQVPHLAQ